MSQSASPTWRRMSLRVSLSIAFGFVVVLTCVLLGCVEYLSFRSFMRADIRKRLVDVATLAVRQLAPDEHRSFRTKADEDTREYRRARGKLRLMRDSIRGLRFIYTMRPTPDGRFVFVLDAEESEADASHIGDVYDSPTPTMHAVCTSPYQAAAEEEFATDKWGTWISGFAPILNADGSLEAIVGVDMSASQIVAQERRMLGMIALMCALTCAVVIVIALLIARSVSTPLLALAGDMSRIQKFDLTGENCLKSHVIEVIAMRDAVNNMRHGLRSFRRYVPADLVRELMRLGREAGLEGERRELTVFFSDIEGFTQLSEKLSPEALIENLGIYLREVTRIIHQNQGTIDKYLGDGVMAFWGAPALLADHSRLACKAVLECQRFLRENADLWTSHGVPPFTTRIGLHTGEAVVGNIGYEERLNYTAMGDAVNLASRLEGLSKFYGTRTLISETVYAAVQGTVEVRLLDVVAVKGKTQAIRVYELVAEKDGVPAAQHELLERFSAAVGLYLERRWDEALKVFGELARRVPDDRPAQIFVERCQACQANPPPADWNGAFVMKEK